VGFEHDRASSGQSRRHLDDVEHEREVERRDGGDHTDRLSHDCGAGHARRATRGGTSLDPLDDVLGVGGVRAEHPDRTGSLDGVGDEAGRSGPATISSRSSPARDSSASAIRTSAAARSCGFVHGHGPWSNALRAASMARKASLVEASGTAPIVSSVAGLMTSMVPPSPPVHWPSMYRSKFHPRVVVVVVRSSWSLLYAAYTSCGIARARAWPRACVDCERHRLQYSQAGGR
jgi:hypothetical protein